MDRSDNGTDSTPIPRYPRLRVSRENVVLVKEGERFGVGSIVNLSPTGAFVATPMALRPGNHVDLSVEIAGLGRIFAVRAEVVWHNHRVFPVVSELPAGYGLSFIASSERERGEVEALFREALRRDLNP